MPKTIAGVELTPHRIKLAVAIVVVLVVLALFYRRIDIEAMHAWAANMNGLVVFAALTFLPMVGFPVSVMHAVTGARFGVAVGLGLVGISIFLQLLASYALVRFAPEFFSRRMAPFRKRLPRGAHRPLTQFTMLLPGVPYFAQNYVLPLVGVPLGTYLVWGTALHLVRSIIGIIFGDVSGDLTPGRIAGFACYGIAITLACGWAFRRLRAQLKDPQ